MQGLETWLSYVWQRKMISFYISFSRTRMKVGSWPTPVTSWHSAVFRHLQGWGRQVPEHAPAPRRQKSGAAWIPPSLHRKATPSGEERERVKTRPSSFLLEGGAGWASLQKEKCLRKMMKALLSYPCGTAYESCTFFKSLSIRLLMMLEMTSHPSHLICHFFQQDSWLKLGYFTRNFPVTLGLPAINAQLG